MHFSQHYAHSISLDELANILYIILILIHNTLYVKMRKSKMNVRHVPSCLLIECEIGSDQMNFMFNSLPLNPTAALLFINQAIILLTQRSPATGDDPTCTRF